MEILLLIAAFSNLPAVQNSTSFCLSSAPHSGHLPPALEAGSTCKHFSFSHIAISKITSPLSGAYSFVPLSMLIKTDFPLPLLPRIPKVEPSSIVKLIFLRTGSPLNDLLIFFNVMKDISPPFSFDNSCNYDFNFDFIFNYNLNLNNYFNCLKINFINYILKI